jgi:tetratricopeptide (TPR) repeat protein
MTVDNQALEYFKQALHYYETEDLQNALAVCETALELDANFADAHNLRGVLLEELGQPLKALGAYRSAIDLNNDFSEAKENLSELEARFAAYSQLVTIARFSFPTEAYISKTRLESEGIWAVVMDADTVTANWLYSNAIGGVRLQVKESDAERAKEILAREAEPIEWDELVDEDEEACPQCGATEIKYERYSMRLVFLSWLLLTVPLPFFKKKWVCQACGCSWKEIDFEENE